MRAMAILCCLATGCFAHSYRVSGLVAEPEPALSEWQSFVFWGLVPVSDEIDLRAACPQGVARVRHGFRIDTWLATFVTLGVYSATHASVYCAEPPALPSLGPRAP